MPFPHIIVKSVLSVLVITLFCFPFKGSAQETEILGGNLDVSLPSPQKNTSSPQKIKSSSEFTSEPPIKDNTPARLPKRKIQKRKIPLSKGHFRGITPEEEAEAMAYDSNNPKEWAADDLYGFQNEKGNIFDMDNNAMDRLYPHAPADPPPKDDMDYSHLFCPSQRRYSRWSSTVDKGHDANRNLLIIHELDCPEFKHLPFLDHDGAGISGELAYRANCEKFWGKVGKMTFEEQQKTHIFDHIPKGCGG